MMGPGAERMVGMLAHDAGIQTTEFDVAKINSIQSDRSVTLTHVGDDASIAGCPLLNVTYKYMVNEYVWVMNRPGAKPLVMGPVVPSSSTPIIKGGFYGQVVNAFGVVSLPHGLGVTPSWAVITPSAGTPGGASAADLVFHPMIDGMDSTYIQILALRIDMAGTLNGSAVYCNWVAGFNP